MSNDANPKKPLKVVWDPEALEQVMKDPRLLEAFPEIDAKMRQAAEEASAAGGGEKALLDALERIFGSRPQPVAPDDPDLPPDRPPTPRH